MVRVGAVLLSLLLLSACAVVDLAAHGVKRYEKTEVQTASQPATQLSVAAQPQAQPTEPQAPAEAVAPVYSGGTISAQPLP